MNKLNLPLFDVKVETINNKVRVFDPLRKKYIVLTPEEWVRQHFINFLINHCDYPKSLIQVERGLGYNKRMKRSDIIIYNRCGGVFLIVECKAPDKQIGKNHLEQVAVYGKSLKPEYLCLTNGINHYFWKMDYINSKVEQIRNVPSANGI